MIAGKLKPILFFIALFFVFDLEAQVEKKISFNGFAGVTLMPLKEELNAAGLSTNIFGKYPPAITVGAGANYRFNPRFSLSNNLFFFYTKKTNYTLSALGMRASLKYFPLQDLKKFSPYLSAGLTVNMVNLSRKAHSQEFLPDSNGNVIGNGISVTKIQYNYDNLKLAFIPMPGATVGAGVNFRLNDKLTLFLDYSYNYTLSNLSNLIKDNYIANKGNLSCHFAGAGVTIKMLKPMKQMLAMLKKNEWDGDPTITVRGTLIYKHDKKSNEKIVPVEMTDIRDTVLTIIPTDKNGFFEYKNLRMEDYKFMLARENKKIVKADLQIIHDNTRIAIFEEYPELTVMEDYDSDNIISRDNNFSVNLHEGFQHEVDITVTGTNVIGRVKPISYDTLCRNLIVLLKNRYDSILAVTEPSEDCMFSFPEVEQGPHKVVFVRKDMTASEAAFSYSFEKNPPLIRRQYYTDEDTIDYNNYDMLEIPEEDTIDIEDILLSRRFERNVVINESFITAKSENKQNTLVQENNTNTIDSVVTKNTEKDTAQNVVVKSNEPKTVVDTNQQVKNVEKKIEPVVSEEKKIVPIAEMQAGSNYSAEGEEQLPKGYGVQVGSFTNAEAAKKFCDKFQKRRKEKIFIQVLLEQDANSYHAKLYRIIAGDYPDVETATKQTEVLKKAGYDTVLRKHRSHLKIRN